MTVIRSAIRSAVRGVIRSALEDRFGGAWWYPGAAADLDFVNQRYYWGGAQRVQGDFTGWTGVTYTAGEGITTAAARGITLTKTAFASGDALTLAASAKGISTPAGTNVITEIWNGTSDELIRIISNATLWLTQARAAAATNAQYTIALDTGVKHAFSISNKDGTSFRSAIDGVSLTPDTIGTAASGTTTLTVGNSAAYVRRVIAFGSTLSDSDQATVTAWLLTNG